jgi:hypothetical protein
MKASRGVYKKNRRLTERSRVKITKISKARNQVWSILTRWLCGRCCKREFLHSPTSKRNYTSLDFPKRIFILWRLDGLALAGCFCSNLCAVVECKRVEVPRAECKQLRRGFSECSSVRMYSKFVDSSTIGWIARLCYTEGCIKQRFQCG